MADVRLGIPAPFDELIERHQREIMRYLLRVAGDRDDAADLFQETWLRAYRAYPRVDPQSDLRPWLFAIATNLYRNHARGRVRRARVIAPPRSDSGDTSSEDSVADFASADNGNSGYAAIHMRRLMGALPAKQRQALMLRHFAGLAYSEIAATLGCSEESVRGNVSQAVRKLKAAW